MESDRKPSDADSRFAEHASFDLVRYCVGARRQHPVLLLPAPLMCLMLRLRGRRCSSRAWGDSDEEDGDGLGMEAVGRRSWGDDSGSASGEYWASEFVCQSELGKI